MGWVGGWGATGKKEGEGNSDWDVNTIKKWIDKQTNNNKVICLCIELARGTAVKFGFNRQPDGFGSPKRVSAHVWGIISITLTDVGRPYCCDNTTLWAWGPEPRKKEKVNWALAGTLFSLECAYNVTNHFTFFRRDFPTMPAYSRELTQPASSTGALSCFTVPEWH